MSAKTRIFSRIGIDLHQIITELMHSLLILATVLIPVSFFTRDYQLQLLGIFFFALLGNFLIRNLTSFIWQFLLATSLLSAICLALPLLPPFAVSIWPRLIAVFFLAFLAGRSFFLRLKQLEDKELPSLMVQTLALLYLLALYLVATRLDLLQVSQSYFYMAIGYLLLALLRWHRLSLAASLDRFQAIPTQPAGRIKRFNKLLLVVFSLLLLLLLLLAPILQIDQLLPFLGSALLSLLRWLINLLGSSEEPTAPEPEPELTPAPSQGMQEPQLPFAPGETARWLQIVQDVFYYLILALSAAIILALIGYMLYWVYKRFYETAQPDSDKTESLLPSLVSDSKERLARVRQKVFISLGQTPAEKVRRHFYRLIEGQIKKGLRLKSSDSPDQILAGLDLERFPELIEIKRLYEAARYGEYSSSSDLSRMQSLCRQLRRQDLRRQLPAGTDKKGLLGLN